jgi:hypothetical protein
LLCTGAAVAGSKGIFLLFYPFGRGALGDVTDGKVADRLFDLIVGKEQMSSAQLVDAHRCALQPLRAFIKQSGNFGLLSRKLQGAERGPGNFDVVVALIRQGKLD